MNQKKFLEKLKEDHLKCVEISSRKNSDYAKLDDAFLNFRACGMLGIDPAVGIVVRMTDKLTRVSNLLNKEASVKDESIADTLFDLANYSIILKLYLENENK